MELNKESIYKLESVENIKLFIIGGKAVLTLESKNTGRWFTYRIRMAKKDDEKSPFFVSLLTGNNNESSYTYLGTIFKKEDKLDFKLTKKSTISEDALSYKAFNFFINQLMSGKIHENLGVYHRGICSVCGKTLTQPESLKNGIGPFCMAVNSKNTKKRLEKI